MACVRQKAPGADDFLRQHQRHAAGVPAGGESNHPGHGEHPGGQRDGCFYRCEQGGRFRLYAAAEYRPCHDDFHRPEQGGGAYGENQAGISDWDWDRGGVFRGGLPCHFAGGAWNHGNVHRGGGCGGGLAGGGLFEKDCIDVSAAWLHQWDTGILPGHGESEGHAVQHVHEHAGTGGGGVGAAVGALAWVRQPGLGEFCGVGRDAGI